MKRTIDANGNIVYLDNSDILLRHKNNNRISDPSGDGIFPVSYMPSTYDLAVALFDTGENEKRYATF